MPPSRNHPGRRREALAGYLFLLPNGIGFLVFSLAPMVMTFLLTFTDWKLAGTPKLNGVSNYTAAVRDPLVWQTARNTVVFSLGAVIPAVVIAFFLALLLNRAVRGITIFRTAVFLPYVTLTVAIAIVWSWIYNPDSGILNRALHWFGIGGPQWLADRHWAMPAIILMSNWRGIGYPTLIFLAALQNVPADYLDAARIDGAGWWARLRHIVLPVVSPATFFILVTSFIGTMQAFDQFYIMTGGGPGYSTTTIVYYIYQNAFAFSKMGYAATIGFALFLVILLITLGQWRLGRRWVHGA